ncbi:MAG: DNRLRE domain-containing protein, partial [Ruminococcus sp.]|nr:DNRLRE domain-containing protein [Ruminococcus sp.]
MINLEKKFIALLTSMSMALTLMPMQEFGSLFTQAEEENKLIENNEIAESSVISEPYITKEIPDLRSEYSKTYEKSDGARVSVMSSKPLHYYDTENNKWEEYDNSLTETTNAQGVDVLTNNNNDFNVEIPETLSEDTDINITTNDYEVSLQPLDVEETVVTEKETNSENKNIEEKTVEDYIKESTTSPTVAYEDAYDDATLEYEVDNTSLKETITLSQAPNDETVYQFEIKSNDLEAELEDNGSVLLKNENNTIFIIPAPFMIDSNNDFSEDIVTELTENEGSYVLSYKPSMEWLSSEERSYPVYIDPTITVSNLNSIEDAYVNSYSPNANYGHSNQLNVGRVEQNNAIAKEFFSYIKFNSLPENPWNNSYITKAELNLGVFRSGDAQINVHEVTSDWDENTITYNSRPETSDIIIDYLDTTDIDDYAQSWDITNLVEEWYDNPEENYGLMLESPNADTYPQMMYSSDYTG